MMRTMAASMAMERSSSTRLGLWLSSTVAMGMRMTRCGQEKPALTVKTSVSPILFEAGSFLRICCVTGEGNGWYWISLS